MLSFSLSLFHSLSLTHYLSSLSHSDYIGHVCIYCKVHAEDEEPMLEFEATSEDEEEDNGEDNSNLQKSRQALSEIIVTSDVFRSPRA